MKEKEEDRKEERKEVRKEEGKKEGRKELRKERKKKIRKEGNKLRNAKLHQPTNSNNKLSLYYYYLLQINVISLFGKLNNYSNFVTQKKHLHYF